MAGQWIFMLVVWVAFEAFGAFRKVPQPKRMRRAAIAAFIIGFLVTVGSMPVETEPVAMYGTAAALNGIAVLIFYGVRAVAEKLLKKAKST